MLYPLSYSRVRFGQLSDDTILPSARNYRIGQFLGDAGSPGGLIPSVLRTTRENACRAA